MKFLSFLLILFTFPVFADINTEKHDIQVDYGFLYHTLDGTQKSNNSRGRLTSPQFPFWSASYSYRFSRHWAVKLFGGVHFVRFDEPQNTDKTLKSENKVLNNHGLELFKRTGAFTRVGYFYQLQDRPLYFAKSPERFEVIEKQFHQSGLTYSISQRRRIGLIWGAGLRAYLLFPTDGGRVTTEGGFGGDTYARLGWIGPLGTTYQIKGFYSISTAPNAAVTFKYEQLGYGFQVNLTF